MTTARFIRFAVLLGLLIVGRATTTTAAGPTVYFDFEGDFNDDPNAGQIADDLTLYGGELVADVPTNAAGSTLSYRIDNTVSFQTAQTDAFSVDLAASDAYTVMFWFKGDDLLQPNNNTRLITVRYKSDSSDAANPAFQVEGFGQGNANGMDMRLNDPLGGLWFAPDAAGVLGDDGDPDNDSWHHVAFVFSNRGSPGNDLAYAETYVDGESVGLAEFPSSTGNPIGNTEGELIVGGTTGARCATGFLDDVAIFDGVVPSPVIAAIAAGQVSPGDVVFADGFEPGDDSAWATIDR